MVRCCDDKGKTKTIFGPRPKKFDSDLVEPGPPAMLTEKGIVLIYNSRNVPSKGDTSLVEGTYAASQILFDKNNPTKVIDRMDTYFMKPDKPYEITGQVNHVCFVEGLVQYKGKWFLYYGTADSKIAVASKMNMQMCRCANMQINTQILSLAHLQICTLAH